MRTVAILSGKDRRAEARGFTDRIGSALLIAKPGIGAGVAAAGLAGMVLGRAGVPDPGILLVCLASILSAASGSAIVNGLLDAPMDARMPRLSGRVAAMGRVGTRGAALLALVLIAAGLLLARRYLNGTAALLLLAAVLSYTVLYTLCLKRRSPYGTIPGGIPGALPVLIGYSAVAGHVGLDGWILFLVMLLWQPPHFWALALKHQDEYREAGVPVLPVARGEPYTRVMIFVYAVALLPMSLALWAFGYCSPAFAGVAAVLWGLFLLASYRNVVVRRRYGRAFGASIAYLMALLAALVLDITLRAL
ncbi:MAG: protoheme IX farnesyltransferase [Deltaproteobacteria bacterium GWC2_65_14]|nr:MAG: protoheme IX farnesyltransferase [Deltaproteobacteria bacterium GWC2_65_14]